MFHDIASRHPAGLTHSRGSDGEFQIVVIVVRDNNVDQALKALKKKMQREGVFREMKARTAYEKPSEAKARRKAEVRPPGAETGP
jgi:small subunit ribosomal protein S21